MKYELSLKPFELQFLNDYFSTISPEQRSLDVKVSASVAGDERNAEELLQLYLDGKKTAGSSLVKDYHYSNEELPKVGSLWIILDSSGDPRCIVKTIRVEHNIFDSVPEAIAIAEGEGDLSLAYWQKAHIEFFEPYLEKFGIVNLSQEEVVTEFFELVYESQPNLFLG